MTIFTKDRSGSDLDIAATNRAGVEFPLNHLVDTIGTPIDPATTGGQNEIASRVEQVGDIFQNNITLTDSILAILVAMFEKMPRVTGNDQGAVFIEGGSVGIAASQALSTVGTLNGVGNKYASGDNIQMSGCMHIYNQITVS